MKRIILLLSLSIVLLSACSNTDEFTGKTYNLSVADGHPSEPVKFRPIVTLEFLKGNKMKSNIWTEEGTYELEEDKLIIHMEDEREEMKLVFALEESTHDFSDYSATLDGDSYFDMKDNEKVSKYKGFYMDMSHSNLEFIGK